MRRKEPDLWEVFKCLAVPAASAGLLPSNDEDGAGGLPHDLVRGGPQEQPPESGFAVRPHHDEVRLGLLRHPEDLLPGLARLHALAHLAKLTRGQRCFDELLPGLIQETRLKRRELGDGTKWS